MARTKAEAGAETETPRFVVTITAPAGPRRRAGFSFGKEPVHLTAADLEGKDTEKSLAGDPLLVIRPYIEPDADAPADA